MGNGTLDQGVDCDMVLVKDTTSIQESSQVALAWLKTINQSSYEAAKAGGGGSYAELFTADYSQFNEKRNALLTSENFQLSVMQARQVLLYKTSDAAITAWSKCVTDKMNDGSLACWVEKMTADGGTLVLRWKPSVAAPKLNHVVVTLDGGTDTHGKSVIKFDTLTGEAMLLFKRPPYNKEVRGTVTGKAGAGGDFAASFYLPPMPAKDREIVVPPSQLLEIMAKNFNRSLNVEVGVLPYGADVIHNCPPYQAAENMVEYDFYLPRSGKYDFEVEYAAAAPRPVEISLSKRGVNVFAINGLQEATGGWSNQQMRKQLTMHIDEGPHTLRLHRNDVFPHIRMLRLVPA
jgi:hypothetical protein